MTFCVYIAKAGTEVIYIGATVNLQQRKQLHASQSRWWGEVTDVEAIPVESADAAAIMEQSLIKMYQPRRNRAGVTSRYVRYTYDPTTPRTRPGAPAGDLAALVTYKEAARRLSVSRATLYRMIEKGDLTPVRLPIGGPRIKVSDVARLTTPTPMDAHS